MFLSLLLYFTYTKYLQLNLNKLNLFNKMSFIFVFIEKYLINLQKKV